MTLGTINRKTGLMLAGLLLGASYSVYVNFFENGATSSPPPSATRRDATAEIGAGSAPSSSASARSTQPRPLVNRNSRGDEFHPVLRKRNARPEDQQFDPNSVDPTLHFALLTKVQELKPEGGQRNLFQFGAAAPAEAKPLGPEPKIAIAKMFDYPRPVPPPAPPPPPPPPTPPSFKYYGLATKRIDNKRTAFFLDGEEIILAIEGMTVKSRWRVVRIGTDSVTLEDLQSKRQVPLNISEDAGGSSGS